MGFTYDSQEDEFDESDFQYKVMNFSLRQLKQRDWLRKKAEKKDDQQKPQTKENDEYGAEEFKAPADDYGVEAFNK